MDPYYVFSMVKNLTDVFTADYTPVRNIETEEYFEQRLDEAGLSNVDVETGGAPLFLDFIRDELFPFMETNYRIDTNMRMLSRYS